MSEVGEVRALVERYGWNTTCYQLVNPGMRHWFSADRQAVVGYVRCAGVTIVAGAPVCAPERLSEIVAAFESAHGPRVCYFGAEDRFREFAMNACTSYATVSLGAQPVWTPQHWAKSIDADPSLRAQLNRAKNKGILIVEWDTRRAENSPELRSRLGEWLRTRGLPPLHFLVEPETLADLAGRRVFVAERLGEPLAFLVLSPVPSRNGWLTEQFVRGTGAPNGVVELMLDTAIRELWAEGEAFVTMGIVPLSKRGDKDQDLRNPIWLRALSGWMRGHGRRFYNFEGLDWFKAKFHPDFWEPVHAISNERRFSFRTLYAISKAFTCGSPIKAVLLGLGKAVGQEWRWLWTRRRPPIARQVSSRPSLDRS